MNRPWSALEGGFSGRKFFRQKGGISSVRAIVRRNQDESGSAQKGRSVADLRAESRPILRHRPKRSEFARIASFIVRRSFVARSSFVRRSADGSSFIRRSFVVRLMVRRSFVVRSSFGWLLRVIGAYLYNAPTRGRLRRRIVGGESRGVMAEAAAGEAGHRAAGRRKKNWKKFSKTFGE